MSALINFTASKLATLHVFRIRWFQPRLLQYKQYVLCPPWPFSDDIVACTPTLSSIFPSYLVLTSTHPPWRNIFDNYQSKWHFWEQQQQHTCIKNKFYTNFKVLAIFCRCTQWLITIWIMTYVMCNIILYVRFFENIQNTLAVRGFMGSAQIHLNQWSQWWFFSTTTASEVTYRSSESILSA